MSLLGIDLGGTKLAAALFSEEGKILLREKYSLEQRKGCEVGKLIGETIISMMGSAEDAGDKVRSTGISVPGISNSGTGTVWAPNIPGWSDYPLLAEVKAITGKVPVTIDSDRACSVLGERWQGNARGCRNVVFIAVGTGIGAGILINDEILRGSNDIAGATGWMALSGPFESKYTGIGCFEYYASGEGIARTARELLAEEAGYSGELRHKPSDKITSYDVFSAYENGDKLSVRVIGKCIEFWGMAAANFVSLFNPEKIIFGGGIFGPARKFLPLIRKEAEKWAQPISITKVAFDVSQLGGDAGIYGAAFLALRKVDQHSELN
ncbi:MAG: ROK family protein [Bacteroidota bacterium]|nr:ROK family protein [Bacteroidota bacterium]